MWLLFPPFIFINLAHRMLPPAAKERRSAGSIAVALLTGPEEEARPHVSTHLRALRVWNRREYYEAVNVLDSKLTPTAAKTDTSAIAPPTAQYM